VSDIVLKRPLPPEIAGDLMAYVGCIAGAISVDEFRRGLTAAGFAHIEIKDAGSDLNAYKKIGNNSSCCAGDAGERSLGLPVIESGCCGTEPAGGDDQFHRRLTETLGRFDVNEYAASVKVFAVKPG
jgi:arsenite methyltransferase